MAKMVQNSKVLHGMQKIARLEPLLDSKNKKTINIAGKMRLNEWKGKRNVEFMIEDISLNASLLKYLDRYLS